jgi:hypothetical protein
MKNIPNKNDIIATKKCERLLIDISWIRTATYVGNRYWLLVMDEYINCLWSFFMKAKDKTKHHVINLVLDLQKIIISRLNSSAVTTQVKTKTFNKKSFKFLRLKYNLNSQLLTFLNKMVKLSASLQLCMVKSAQL